MTTTADICIAPHAVDPDRPRRAIDGQYLCHGHRLDLEQLVAEMPGAYGDLDRPRTLGPKAYGGGGDSPGLSVDSAAADLRRAMADTLASWCRVVSEDRGVTPPAGPEITRTAPWLVRHIDWCAANRWVDEMLAELRELASSARRLVDLPARRVPLGTACLHHADGQPCTGTITLWIRGDDWTARCDVCAGDQEPGPYLRAMTKPNQWITTDGVIRLAHMAGIPCSSDVVWQWHHRGRIVGRRGADGVMYELASVNTYLAKRQAERERVAS